jgi:hypothetical protein
MDFVLTADLDWASDYCVEHFLGIAARFSVTPTLFVTHDSPVVRAAAAEGRAELAIHPNFLEGSTHGSDPASVIAHVLRLVPNAREVRCHRFLDNAAIQRALVEHGLRVDSNACRHLERGIGPERLASGLLRLPVFFEDDVHWNRGLAWNFKSYESDFFSSGLKVLNFHPFFTTLNVPDADFYARHKRLIETLTADEAAALRQRGPGAETFLMECLGAILAAGHRFLSLAQMVEANPGWQRIGATTALA